MKQSLSAFLMKRMTLLLLCFAFVAVSCNKENTPKPASAKAEEGNYFSIVEFTRDQLHTHWNQPYTLLKTVTLNGNTDTSFAPANTLDWSAVFKVFFESDISNLKFLEAYDFSSFYEDLTDTRTYNYQAKDAKLFTRKLQVNTDAENGKITSIYIETKKETALSTKEQKLYYAPLKVIQIQEHTGGTAIESRDLRVAYYFEY